MNEKQIDQDLSQPQLLNLLTIFNQARSQQLPHPSVYYFVSVGVCPQIKEYRTITEETILSCSRNSEQRVHYNHKSLPNHRIHLISAWMKKSICLMFFLLIYICIQLIFCLTKVVNPGVRCSVNSVLFVCSFFVDGKSSWRDISGVGPCRTNA